MIVIACNLLKTTILLFVWLAIQDAPILTIGDAIASFLSHPDPFSKDICLVTKREVNSRPQPSYLPSTITLKPLDQPKPFKFSRRRWMSAASPCRWMFGILFGGVRVVTCFVSLMVGVSKQSESGTNHWTQELGTVGA